MEKPIQPRPYFDPAKLQAIVDAARRIQPWPAVIEKVPPMARPETYDRSLPYAR